MKLSFALALPAAIAVWAADTTPLNLKPGEWEYTVTMKMTGGGMPAGAAAMSQIPPEQLAKIPPEQRAKIEAAMKQANDMASGKPTTNTSKSCVKKEDLAMLNPLGNADKSCKMTVINSSPSKLDARMSCDSPGNKTSASVTIEALSPEASKFTVISSGISNGSPMNMTVNGMGKWLSATCTDK